jgi:hypothetical protein
MDRNDLEKKYGRGQTSYLSWPVSFKDIPGDFHLTCKFLGDSPYEVSQLVEALKVLDTSGPKASEISWLPHTFDTKNDGLVKVLLIEGCPARMKQCHDALAAFRKDDYPEWKAHITVDPEIWDEVKEHGLTPQDFEVTFGPLQLKNGRRLVHEWKEQNEN